MKRSVELPGIIWTILLVGLPMLSVWLEQYFGAFAWAAPIAGLILIVAKVAQVYGDGGSVERPQFEAAPYRSESKAREVLFG